MSPGLDFLVAEDSADDVFFLRQAIKKSNLEIRLYSVCDGLEAQAYLKGDNAYQDRKKFPFPDALLLDLNMPRMNGFELLEWVRKDSRCACLLVHVLTASSRESDVQRAYALHANSYVMKPSRVDQLEEFVSILLKWSCVISYPHNPGEPQRKNSRRTAGRRSAPNPAEGGGSAAL